MASREQKRLLAIAKDAIENNWYRGEDDSGYHNFSKEDLIAYGFPKSNRGGYCFLDDDHGKEGMIRIYLYRGNPKWTFWKEDGVMKVDMA